MRFFFSINNSWQSISQKGRKQKKNPTLPIHLIASGFTLLQTCLLQPMLEAKCFCPKTCSGAIPISHFRTHCLSRAGTAQVSCLPQDPGACSQPPEGTLQAGTRMWHHRTDTLTPKREEERLKCFRPKIKKQVELFCLNFEWTKQCYTEGQRNV